MKDTLKVAELEAELKEWAGCNWKDEYPNYDCLALEQKIAVLEDALHFWKDDSGV